MTFIQKSGGGTEAAILKILWQGEIFGVGPLEGAALGCNIAWGIIDAIMYVMNCVTERAGKSRLADMVKSAPDSEAALAIVRREIEPQFEMNADPASSLKLSEAVLDCPDHNASCSHRQGGPRPRLGLLSSGRAGLHAGRRTVHDRTNQLLALRISNAILLAMLFLVGGMWAR